MVVADGFMLRWWLNRHNLWFPEHFVRLLEAVAAVLFLAGGQVVVIEGLLLFQIRSLSLTKADRKWPGVNSMKPFWPKITDKT
jgi:hypothetical protein